MELVVVGINYRQAALDERERYAVPRDDVPRVCRELTSNGAIAEAVVLSTCNRVEIYAIPRAGKGGNEAAAAVRTSLGPASNAFYTIVGLEAVRHLCRVSGSLDSMVVGEPQILGQGKEAFEIAKEAGTVGPALHGTFARAFKAAKRIRTETDIAKAAVSVGHVAVELAKTIFGDVSQTNVLLVGAGKMGVMAANHLASNGAKRVLVANRTYERGKALADLHGWTASAYEDLQFLLASVDVVICSTGAPRPILNKAFIQPAVKQRRFRPLFLIDIAVPRDIDRDCGELDGVYLYNIDDLEQVSRQNASGRAAAAVAADRIVHEEVEAIGRWHRERLAAPTIQALRDKALAVAAAEAEKTIKMLPGLDEKGAATVQKLAEVIASRLIRGPMTALKRAAEGKEHGDDLAAVIEDLFELNVAHPGAPEKPHEPE